MTNQVKVIFGTSGEDDVKLSRLAKKLIEFLDAQPEDMCWGIVEITQKMGYSLSHMHKTVNTEPALKEYTTLHYKGGKPYRILGNKKAIESYNNQLLGA